MGWFKDITGGITDWVGDAVGGVFGGVAEGVVGGPPDSVVGRLNRDQIEELTTFNTGQIYKDLLAELTAPGASLSSAQTSREFAGLSTATLTKLDNHFLDVFRAARSGGLSQSRAKAGYRTTSFDALRGLITGRASLEGKRQDDYTQARIALANAVAGQDVAEKDRTLAALQREETLDVEKEIGYQSAKANVAGGLFEGVGNILGGLF